MYLPKPVARQHCASAAGWAVTAAAGCAAALCAGLHAVLACAGDGPAQPL